jgi:hypothetical protein
MSNRRCISRFHDNGGQPNGFPEIASGYLVGHSNRLLPQQKDSLEVLCFAAFAKNFALFPGHPVFPIIVRAADGSVIRLGGIMHWVKLVVEVWVLSGIMTVILGFLWTSKLTRESQSNKIKNTSSVPRGEFSATNLSKVA